MKLLPELIEELFSHELSRHNWSKYTTKMIIEVITAKYNMRNPKSQLELNLLLKKLKETLPIEETLVILTDEVYGRIKD